MTTADYLESLQNDLETIKTNLSEGGMSIDEGDNFTNIATKTVGIVIGGGGQEVKEKDVNFYFHDGSVLASYTTNEFLNLTALPTAPEIEGLTFVNWNWNLTDAKAFVTEFKKLDIGALYRTSDNSLRLYINLTEERKEPYVSFAIVGTATIDWGDNSSESVTGSSVSTIKSTKHSYSHGGKYLIKITSNTTIYVAGTNNQGCRLVWNNDTSYNYANRAYQSTIYKIEMGNNVSLGNYSFKYLQKLEYIVAPVLPSGNGMFTNCVKLKHINISDTVYSIANSLFTSLYNLELICLPNTITSLGNSCFNYSNSIKRIIIPNSVTTIGTYQFQNDINLKEVIIGNGITSFTNNMFSSCLSLERIIGLKNITAIPNDFAGSLTNLSEFIIPSGVTSIGNSGISGNTLLTKLTFPAGITTIGGGAFGGNLGMKVYDFSNAEQIPTLGNTMVFSNMPTDCKIVVPDSLYESWKTTGNWTNYSSYIISKSDYDNL